MLWVSGDGRATAGEVSAELVPSPSLRPQVNQRQPPEPARASAVPPQCPLLARRSFVRACVCLAQRPSPRPCQHVKKRQPCHHINHRQRDALERPRRAHWRDERERFLAVHRPSHALAPCHESDRHCAVAFLHFPRRELPRQRPRCSLRLAARSTIPQQSRGQGPLSFADDNGWRGRGGSKRKGLLRHERGFQI